MSTTKSPERLVFFSDAVVAIALTLLVLPLADTVPEVVNSGGNVTEVFTRHDWKIYSFLLSFAVIARMWVAHHRLYERVAAYSRALMFVNFLWLLTMVVLPFPTEMVGAFHSTRLIVGVYVGTVLATSLCQLVMTWLVRRDPGLLAPGATIDDHLWVSTVASASGLAVAFALGAFVPGVGYFGLLLLVLTGRLVRLFDRRATPAEV